MHSHVHRQPFDVSLYSKKNSILFNKPQLKFIS